MQPRLDRVFRNAERVRRFARRQALHLAQKDDHTKRRRQRRRAPASGGGAARRCPRALPDSCPASWRLLRRAPVRIPAAASSSDSTWRGSSTRWRRDIRHAFRTVRYSHGRNACGVAQPRHEAVSLHERFLHHVFGILGMAADRAAEAPRHRLGLEQQRSIAARSPAARTAGQIGQRRPRVAHRARLRDAEPGDFVTALAVTGRPDEEIGAGRAIFAGPFYGLRAGIRMGSGIRDRGIGDRVASGWGSLGIGDQGPGCTGAGVLPDPGSRSLIPDPWTRSLSPIPQPCISHPG